MIQKLEHVLAIQMTCPSDIELDEPVVLSDDMTVAAISGAGDVMLIGTVEAHEAGETVCTVATKYRMRKDTRESANGPPVGPFVYDANGKVIEYDDVSHDESMIAGMVISLPDPPSVTGRESETFDITTGTNDAFKVQVGSATAETVIFTQGTDRTAADLVAELNTQITEAATAEVVYPGKIKISCDDPYDDLDIQTVANDAYTTLGFDVATHTASVIVETLEK